MNSRRKQKKIHGVEAPATCNIPGYPSEEPGHSPRREKGRACVSLGLLPQPAGPVRFHVHANRYTPPNTTLPEPRAGTELVIPETDVSGSTALES